MVVTRGEGGTHHGTDGHAQAFRIGIGRRRPSGAAIHPIKRAGTFSRYERDAVYRAIFERRDVRRNFLPIPISDEVLLRLLTAAHHAGSVGFMQPWDFVVVRHPRTKRAVKSIFRRINNEAAMQYDGARADLYRSLKLEGIEEAPVNLCVTCNRRRGGRAVLGRSTVRDTDLYSTCCAIQNLWLAARAEGIGVGWVSIMDHAALKRVLGIPKPVTVLAYLCLGYVSEFEKRPDLETTGWRARLPLDRLVHYESWGNNIELQRRSRNAQPKAVRQNQEEGHEEDKQRASQTGPRAGRSLIGKESGSARLGGESGAQSLRGHRPGARSGNGRANQTPSKREVVRLEDDGGSGRSRRVVSKTGAGVPGDRRGLPDSVAEQPGRNGNGR